MGLIDRRVVIVAYLSVKQKVWYNSTLHQATWPKIHLHTVMARSHINVPTVSSFSKLHQLPIEVKAYTKPNPLILLILLIIYQIWSA